jgi:uncharacterized protein YbcV (DUF1398 family)
MAILNHALQITRKLNTNENSVTYYIKIMSSGMSHNVIWWAETTISEDMLTLKTEPTGSCAYLPN